MNCELFSQNLADMNYMQLAEWLFACRAFIRRDNYDTYADYVSAVAVFCAEWEQHYQANDGYYKTDKFKKALYYALFQQRLNCYYDFSEAKERIDASYRNLMQHSVFVEKEKPLLKEIEQEFRISYVELQQIFENKTDYKERLHKAVLQQAFNTSDIRIRAFSDGGRWIKGASYQEFLDKCEKQSYYFECESRTKKNSYVVALRQYDITKTVYQDFVSDTAQEQEFGKKFFVNLSFALGLNATNAETLFNWNGYTMMGSAREFDKICQKVFKIGLGREYMIALIDKYNMELARRYKKFTPMPNITISKR